MNGEKEYYTLRGYDKRQKSLLTPAMEDYLEMIYRQVRDGEMHIMELAKMLNVKASSVTKMIGRLKELKMVIYRRYGKARLTTLGLEHGKFLLYRHNVLQSFFKYLNKEDYSLELVEKIEHFIDEKTIINMDLFLKEKYNL